MTLTEAVELSELAELGVSNNWRKHLRKVEKRKSKRVLRRRALQYWEVDNEIMNNEKIFLGASDYGDFIITQTFDRRTTSGKSTHISEQKYLGTRQEWKVFVNMYFKNQFILELAEDDGIIITDDVNFLRYDNSSNSITVKIYGDQEFIDKTFEEIGEVFEEVTSYIEWIYSANGESVNVPLNKERLPIQEMYPFLQGESLDAYYNRFLKSDSNILLLIGPPGTGKTTFIRGLLAYNDSSAIVTYDSAILEKDYLFARFIEGSDDVMVLEDSDNFLKARSDGNTMMHRFLNVGDGLVTTKGKKLIFSTNLPSIRDVDPALIRPGRCFDVLNFDTLTQSQAESLANKIGVKLDGSRERWSLAEIFNKQIETSNNKKLGTKMGFI